MCIIGIPVPDGALVCRLALCLFFFFFQAEDGIRDKLVTGVQTCALPISRRPTSSRLPCLRSPAVCETPVTLPVISANGTWAVGVMSPTPRFLPLTASTNRSEERRVGKECRSRWSPYH